MSDILIKGLTLPKKGDSLMIYVFPSGNVDYKGFHEMETHRTTASELPPHGRLIEAYFDYAEFKKHYKDAFGDNFDLYNAFSIFNDMVVNAPTVLEANNGSDN